MIDMDKLHNNKSYRDWDSENYYFVMRRSAVQLRLRAPNFLYKFSYFAVF